MTRSVVRALTRAGIAVALLLSSLSAFGVATLTIDASNNVTYAGTGVANALTVSFAGGTYTFNDTGETITVVNNGTSVVAGSGTNTVTATLIGTISINTDGGVDIVNIQSTKTDAGTCVSVDTAIGVPDTTNLGSAGLVSGILCGVSVTDTGGVGTLNVNAFNDPTARTVTVSGTSISGLTSVPVSFGVGIAPVLNGGFGGNTITVTNTTSDTFQTTTINSGDGTDNVIVQATTSALVIDTEIGVPDTTMIGNAGLTSGINAAVTVSDNGGVGNLVINNSADATPKTVTIGAGAVTGISPAAINFGSGIIAVAVTTGSASDTFNVTPSADVTFTITGGNPTPPSLPGDTLNVTFGGATSPSLSGTSTASGFQGSWSFADRDPIDFSQIETVTPVIAAQVIVLSGTPQTTPIGQSFPDPLVVQVLDGLGQPIPNVSVTFTPPGIGASAFLTIPALTNSEGITQVTATANGIVGSYQVTASVAGVASTAVFNLTNADVPLIPTLSQLGLLMLMLMVGVAAFVARKRRPE